MEEGTAVVATDTRVEVPPEHSGVGEPPGGGGARLRELYPEDELLTHDADFLVDDQSSAYSSMEVADRLSYLEQRVQMQEDEIQLLKLALADVLKRLNISEEQSPAFTKRCPVQAARPVSLALSSRDASSTTLPLKKGSSSNQHCSWRNFRPSTASRRSSPGSVKGSPSDSGSRRPPTAITTTSTSRKLQESSKPKEASVRVVERQRVNHCKVTMQIYLSPLRRRTGSTEAAAAAAKRPSTHPPSGRPPPGELASKETEAGAQRSRVLSVPLQKSPCQSPFSPTDIPIYKFPSKAASQYFQICY